MESFGVRLGVRLDSADAEERARRLVPPGSVPIPGAEVDHLVSLITGRRAEGRRRGTRRYALLYVDGVRVARSLDPEEVWRACRDELEVRVALGAPDLRFVHAGAVAWRGRAVVLPGRTWSGKTTLVAELLGLGAALLSDEYAVIDRKGGVHPWPRDLVFKDGAHVRRVPGSELGQVETAARSLGAVIATWYRPGARFRPAPLSPGRGVLELLAHAVAARSRPRESLEDLAAAAESVAAWRGVRGEAAAAARGICELLDAQADRCRSSSSEACHSE